MSVTKDRPPRIERWVTSIEEEAADDLLVDLGSNFRYLLEHREEWNQDDLDYQGLPAFNRGVKWLITRSAVVGMEIAASNATLFALSGVDNECLGVFGSEANADELAQKRPDRIVVEMDVETHPIETWYEPMLAAEGDGPRAVGENLEYIAHRQSAFLEGEIDGEDLPRLPHTTRDIQVFSVLFGVLWEYSDPWLWGLYEGDRLDSLYRHCSLAPQKGEGWQTERVAVEDGDVEAAEQLGEFQGSLGGKDE